MLLTIFNVVYVLVALGMIILILLQRGAGAAAGSGFGGGASGTVFGARGATTFLSRGTAVLAGLFFLLSLGMGAFLGNPGTGKQADDLGIMSGVETPAPKEPAAPAAGGDVPTPAAGAPATDGGDKPAAAPAPAAPSPVAPAKDSGNKGQPSEPEKH